MEVVPELLQDVHVVSSMVAATCIGTVPCFLTCTCLCSFKVRETSLGTALAGRVSKIPALTKLAITLKVTSSTRRMHMAVVRVTRFFW